MGNSTSTQDFSALKQSPLNQGKSQLDLSLEDIDLPDPVDSVLDKVLYEKQIVQNYETTQ